MYGIQDWIPESNFINFVLIWGFFIKEQQNMGGFLFCLKINVSMTSNNYEILLH
jgi:hypothetical protein